MDWPAPTDFSDAVQNPQQCFEDEDLAQGVTAVNRRGTPISWSGNFACVFKLGAPGGDVAVRCFTRKVNDQQERYGHLSAYLTGVRPEFLVGFEYVERGIRVKGDWYPIVRMDWAEGDRLDKFIDGHLDRPDIFMDLAARWRGVNGTLRGLGIAHNDLQHGNVMVQEQGALRLVDYDGIYLPRFEGEPSPEIGHRHYQHPKRTSQHYFDGIDNFPSLVVYLTLLALRADPALWERFYNQENMLFTKDDFADPANSQCFKALKVSTDDNVAGLAAALEEFCSRPVDQVPPLEEVLRGALTAPLPTPSSNTPAAPPAPTPTPAPTGASSPPAPAAPPTPAPVPSTPSTAGSSYRDLLQSGGAAASTPPAPSAPPPAPAPPRAPAAPPAPATPVLVCPSCNRTSSTEHIYCGYEDCATVLLPGRKTCNSCRASVPLNSYFCSECGVSLAAPASV